MQEVIELGSTRVGAHPVMLGSVITSSGSPSFVSSESGPELCRRGECTGTNAVESGLWIGRYW